MHFLWEQSKPVALFYQWNIFSRELRWILISVTSICGWPCPGSRAGRSGWRKIPGFVTKPWGSPGAESGSRLPGVLAEWSGLIKWSNWCRHDSLCCIHRWSRVWNVPTLLIIRLENILVVSFFFSLSPFRWVYFQFKYVSKVFSQVQSFQSHFSSPFEFELFEAASVVPIPVWSFNCAVPLMFSISSKVRVLSFLVVHNFVQLSLY